MRLIFVNAFLIHFTCINGDGLSLADYTLDISIQNRYVVSEVTAIVQNPSNDTVDYKFAVNLAPNEFISRYFMSTG